MEKNVTLAIWSFVPRNEGSKWLVMSASLKLLVDTNQNIS